MVKKNVEVIGAIEHAIYKLIELERSVYHGEVIVQDIRVGNQYLAQDGNGLPTFQSISIMKLTKRKNLVKASDRL